MSQSIPIQPVAGQAPGSSSTSTSTSAPVPQPQPVVITETAFTKLCKQLELQPDVIADLSNVLTKCKIIILCDDSGSMQTSIYEPDTKTTTTRWAEAKRLCATILKFLLAIQGNNPEGIDLHFFGRNNIDNITSLDGMQQVFAADPTSGTPLIGTVRDICRRYSPRATADKPVLLIVITDGKPSDGDGEEEHWDFYNIVKTRGGTNNNNIHISFAECTDCERDMEYLDRWDRDPRYRITNYDNTDDYREELRAVQMNNTPGFKFTYNDYVIKILLATFRKKYFNLDQPRSTYNSGYNNSGYNQGNNYSQNSSCCTIL